MPGERDLVQVDLLAQDQVEQQIERTFERLGLHVVGHGAQCTAPSCTRVICPVTDARQCYVHCRGAPG